MKTWITKPWNGVATGVVGLILFLAETKYKSYLPFDPHGAFVAVGWVLLIIGIIGNAVYVFKYGPLSNSPHKD